MTVNGPSSPCRDLEVIEVFGGPVPALISAAGGIGCPTRRPLQTSAGSQSRSRQARHGCRPLRGMATYKDVYSLMQSSTLPRLLRYGWPTRIRGHKPSTGRTDSSPTGRRRLKTTYETFEWSVLSKRRPPGKGSPCGLHLAPNSAVKRPPFIAESYMQTGSIQNACSAAGSNRRVFEPVCKCRHTHQVHIESARQLPIRKQVQNRP
jgi:hypothetical protein